MPFHITKRCDQTRFTDSLEIKEILGALNFENFGLGLGKSRKIKSFVT